ncbi:glycosyltransferase family 2 protein [Iningainema tapete]|uniref:Glycosyltransferase family 2 protein n=1 Tax=Iningainema tapete BLCC-T55 TaxID=2748662 RepID=A0A8J6XK80_9CYAN|nr:glycosyltransferase family 2 protein [Iningainema tapete]MBD2774447.1 glycosyltransferase family 2 protein [Iningainema tapete BLCC-T55]
MNKLLTIAIPTYNRAELLDKQLAWLAHALKGFESDCEIFVSDNCSPDNTQEVIKKWQEILSNVTFKSHKHAENVGVMKNIIHCLKSATTQYVWAIGDDDPIQDRAISYVFNNIKKHQNLSLLFLNFSGRNKITNEPVHPPTIVGNRWFDADSEDGDGDSKAIFAHCFAKSVGAVIFLTATVYRTQDVQRALQIWPDAADNWISLAYLAGYCAANGNMIVSKDTYLECIVGVSYWQKEPKSALLMQYKHIPEVLLRLEQCGYSPRFCRGMIVKNFKEVNLKVFLGALRRWPLSSLKILVPFLALVGISAIEYLKKAKGSGQWAEGNLIVNKI